MKTGRGRRKCLYCGMEGEHAIVPVKKGLYPAEWARLSRRSAGQCRDRIACFIRSKTKTDPNARRVLLDKARHARAQAALVP